MPPNRKPSSSGRSDQYVLCLRPTKDYRHAGGPSSTPRPIVDESYWHWPATGGSGDGDDIQQLFSADHIVATLVREASRQQQVREDEKEEEDEEGGGVKEEDNVTSIIPATTPAAEQQFHEYQDNVDDRKCCYWDWTNVLPRRPPSRHSIDDRWTSGIAIERDLVRDHVAPANTATAIQQQQQQPAAAATTITTFDTINSNNKNENDNHRHHPDHDDDTYWGWEAFPRHAMGQRFSHTRYERHLLLQRERSHNRNYTTATTTKVAAIRVNHQNDDYWHGL